MGPLAVNSVDLTRLIESAVGGDADALGQVYTILYAELRSIARAQLRRGGGDNVINATSLVHESYAKLANSGRMQVEDRKHFLRYAARTMRSVVVDLVRAENAERRGGDARPVTLTTSALAKPSDQFDVLRLHRALEALERHDARMVQVVELRYFAGLTVDDTAMALGITDRSVRRIWKRAQVWLAEALE